MEQEAITDKILQMEVVARIYELNESNAYDPKLYIINRGNINARQQMLVVIPEVDVTNEEHEHYTTVEVQATDRIGLLHDVLSLFSELGLVTKGARITTERNTAIDTFLVADEVGNKLSNKVMEVLEKRVLEVAKS